MALLTEADRTYVLEQLRLAPDSVLADAMLAFNRIRDNVVIVRNMALNGTPVLKPKSELPEPRERANVSPGVSLISKIGGPTRATILEELVDGIQPGPKFSEHMKLLWSRGEVKFDGEEYYL